MTYSIEAMFSEIDADVSYGIAGGHPYGEAHYANIDFFWSWQQG
jgi:hypothetical protein